MGINTNIKTDITDKPSGGEKRDELRFESLLVHGGYISGEHGETNPPIYNSASFEYAGAEEIERVFNNRAPGMVYSRIGNPTTAFLEKKLALLEGGLAALAVASGMGAISAAALTLLRSGDEVLASHSLFGGTYSLFISTLANFGVKVRFFDPCKAETLAGLVGPDSKLIFIEALGNPRLDIPEFNEIKEIANGTKTPLVIDATAVSPAIVRGIDLGADITVHSTTKYINGAGSAVGGALIDSGTFDWADSQFETLAELAKRYRRFAFIARARKIYLTDLGGCAAPANSSSQLDGLQTLALRIERHCENAGRLAEFLAADARVDQTNYPGLAESPSRDRAKKYFGGKNGGLITIRLGSKKRCFEVINALKLAKNLANIGDAKTLVIHPASTIYAEFSAEARELLGVEDDLIRISVGIEHIDDIIADFDSALGN